MEAQPQPQTPDPAADFANILSAGMGKITPQQYVEDMRTGLASLPKLEALVEKLLKTPVTNANYRSMHEVVGALSSLECYCFNNSLDKATTERVTKAEYALAKHIAKLPQAQSRALDRTDRKLIAYLCGTRRWRMWTENLPAMLTRLLTQGLLFKATREDSGFVDYFCVGPHLALGDNVFTTTRDGRGSYRQYYSTYALQAFYVGTYERPDLTAALEALPIPDLPDRYTKTSTGGGRHCARMNCSHADIRALIAAGYGT